MRYVCSSTAIVVALSTFAPTAVCGASNLSIANYQVVSDQRVTLTHWHVTFKADLVNTGPALPGITATVASNSNTVQVAGQGTLHFSPVPANSRVTSADTFTLLVDRSVTFDWSQVEWSFTNPVANAGPNQTAPVTGTVTLDGSASSNPTGVGTLSYSWTFQSVPPGSKAALARANTASPSFVVDGPGTYRCRLIVTNGAGSDSAMVTVSTINSPPVAAAGPNQTVATRSAVTLNGSKSSDVDGDALTYAWSFISRPAASSAVLLAAQTASPTFVADVPGRYIAQLVVRDGQVDSEPSTVTVSTLNTPPVARAGGNQTVTAGMFVQLNGADSTDVDGDALTYRWSFNSLAPGSTAALSNPAAVNPTFTADKTGTYIVQLIVNDGTVDSPASTVTITTNAVQAPTAKAGGDMTVHAGSTVQLAGSGTDPQSFNLVYSWSLPTRPPNSTATLSAPNISNPTFVADLPGIYGAQLVVSNGVLSSAPSIVTITTTNTPPVANPGPPQSAYTGDTVYLDGGQSSDVDNDPITAYSWSFTSKPDGSSALLSGANTRTPNFVADVAGAYVAQLIVGDKFANSQAKTVTIDVGTKTLALNPNPLALYSNSAAGTLNITLSPTPTSPVSVAINAGTPAVASFSPNPATVPANSSGVNVTVTPIASGSTTITASAAGYYSSTGAITVTKPTISIALNGGATTVGLTHKAAGSVSVNAPAPSGGTVVTLTSAPAPDGNVGFDSITVAIPPGSTSATFGITGLQAGTATIHATAPGYNSGSQTVQAVILGSVSLPAGFTVGSGQSAPLNVQITAPAPADGVTLNLTCSDPGKLTISPASVLIKSGATAPETPPQVTAAAAVVGEAAVTATAGGFYQDRQTIKVMGSVTFEEQAVSVGPGGVTSFTILLSAPAPTGGLLVNLNSSDASVANPEQLAVVFSGGQQSVQGRVWGVAVGTAQITLSMNPTIPGGQYFSCAGLALNVTVTRPSVSIGTQSLPAGTAGANYPTTWLSATGGTGSGYFWTIPNGSLPSGLSLSPGGVISGSLTSSAMTSSFTVQVQDSGGNKDTKTFTITVNPLIGIATEALPPGTAGTAYSSTTLAATGGTGMPYTWSLAAGALPSALSLSPAGVISGNLSSSAVTSTFTVQVQDGATNTATKQFTMTVNPALGITTGSLPAGMAGAAYPSTTLAAAGGTASGYNWSITTGSLPLGLILSGTGAISGTVNASATNSTFTVQVQDSGGNKATKQFTIAVTPPLTITTASLPDGTAGTAYASVTLTATGGTGSGYTWTVSAGLLPPDLTLSAAGVLSGTLSNSASTSTFTIKAQDSAGNAATKDFTLTVHSTLSITTPSVPVGTAGGAYPSTTLTASGGTGGYSWSLPVGNSLPTGLILSTAGVISGSLSASATNATFTVQVKDSANNTATKQFTLTVHAALAITTASLPHGMVGASYTATTLEVSGGSGAGYNWTVSAGSLPTGLALSPGGVLSGTVGSGAATSTFTIQVEDSAGCKAIKEFILTIYTALTITTPSLPAGVAGASYPSKLLTATGGSGNGHTWSVSAGALPNDIVLSSGGVLSGTLSSAATTSTFTIQVKDSANNIGSKEFTLTVNATLAITTESLPPGTGGAAYTPTTLTASGGSGSGYSWSLSAGTPPLGLSLNAGVLSGTLSPNATNSTFTIQVEDGAGNHATKQFSISVTLTVTTASLPAGDPGKSYSTPLAASGGTGTGRTWSVSAGSPPSGVTLSAAGTLAGILSTAASTSTFTVQVQDGGGNTATRQFTLTVNPALTITTASLPAGTVGAAYPSTTLAASGGTGIGYTWSHVGSLPAGLSLSPEGAVSGTVSGSATSSTFTVQVQDSGANIATRQFTITVEVTLTIVTPSLPKGSAGASYPTTTLQAGGGTGTGYTWSITAGSLPDGLTLSGASISGTLSASASTSTFTVQVQDSGSHIATKQFILTVNPALIITTASLPAGTAGSAYPSTNLAAAGGSGTGYTWSITDGSAPSGLVLSAGGVLSGTLLSSAAPSTFTVRVQDSELATTTKQFTIAVNPPLVITTASLPAGMAGASYPSPTLAASGGTGLGHSWSVTAGAPPSGLTLSAAGVLSGTLAADATSSTFTVQAQDSGSNTATRQFTITVHPALAITTMSLPAGIQGNAYPSTTLAPSGGTGAGYVWSISAGSLPLGLSLSGGGVLSGTVAASATSSNVTIQVQDSGGNTATRAFSIGIGPALSIATASLPDGVAGTPYTTTNLTATGGTGAGYAWSVSAGVPPEGVTLTPAGMLSGNLSASATTAVFTIQVKDNGNNTATKQFTVTVTSGLGVLTALLPNGIAGTAYGPVTLTATGGSGTGQTWSLTAGSLPAGLALTAGGVLSGTLATTATTATFTIQVQDSVNSKATRQFTLTVNPALSIAASSLPVGIAGSDYPLTTLTASGGAGPGYTWSVSAGSLPDGLALGAAGAISGTLSVSAATSTFTAHVQDSGGNAATRQFTITVNPAVQITTASLPTGIPGGAYPSTTLAASGGTGTGYTWSVSIGSLPSALVLSSGGVLSGTLAGSVATSTFTIQAQDSAGNTGRKQFTLAVTLTVTTTALPGGTAGVAYAGATLAASGGSGAGYTWSVSAGSLPAGLAISAGGAISGTLLGSATSSTFTVQVQDNAGNTATKQLTITVGAALSIDTATLPAGSASAAYPSTTLSASGGSGAGYAWTIAGGSLPAGLALSGGGVLSGTLSSLAVTSTFTVQVQDSASHTATKQFTITVNPPLTVTTGSLPTGAAGSGYPSTTLGASGGTGSGYAWSVSAGSLPAGLALSGGGVISGTLAGSAVSATFTIQVQDSGSNTATKQFTITVNPALGITTTTLPTGVAGSPYPATTLVASGGTGTGHTWSVSAGSLPTGLALSGGGVLSGTLDAAATSATFTIQVQDSGSNTATKPFTITVNPALNITTTTLPTGIAGSAYPSTTLTVSGGTGTGHTWSVTAGSLPAGLALTSGGVISGTLSNSAASSTFTVEVQDGGSHTATKHLTIAVNPALEITTATLPTGVAGSTYPSTTLAAAGGTGIGYTWSVTAGSAPSGLALSSSGVLAGTLSSSAATATFTVQVQDSGSHTATRQFILTVSPALLITTTSVPAGLAGAAYPSTTLAATGGSGAGYAWSVTAGSLPSGLALSAGGVISGTLDTSAATSTFTIQVQDGGSNTATRQFTLTVSPALSITTASLPDGFAGASYPSTTLTAAGGTGSGYVWSVTAGGLPAGLILSGAGVISGTLTTAAATTSFTVQVKDNGNNTATKQFTLTVNPALSITTDALPAGVAGAAYSATLAATGGTGGGYTWSVSAGSPPDGLTLSAAGVLFGTLSGSATGSTFTVQVQDNGFNSAIKQYVLTVNPAPSITTGSLPNGLAGAAYPSASLAASGGTGTGYTWSVTAGSLPTGLALSAAGVLAGTLSSSATTSTFTVQVRDSGSNTATKQFTLTVLPALTITTGPLPGGTAGTVYSSGLAATGGTGSGYAWSITAGALPLNLGLSGAGTISGTLSYVAVTSNFTVQVRDSGNNTATKQFTIAVTPAALTIATNPVLLNATTGQPYSAQILAVGGTLPYTWSASGLPSWLTLDTSGGPCGGAGVVCGTPPVPGPVSFTITVTDNASPTHQSFSQIFSLTVMSVGGLGTITVPNVSVGVNLQTPIIITLSPPTSVTTIVSLTSSNPGAVLLGNSAEVGKSPVNVALAAGSTTIQVFAKALSASSPVTISASADTGYTTGSGTATITNSGILISGPNGIGSDFTTYQGVTTGLTVYPYRLGTNNVPVENQSIRGGVVVNAPVGVAPGSMGTMGATTVAINGGDLSAITLFTASSSNTGNGSITVTPPGGFTVPATGSTLNVNIQSSGFIVPSGVTVGRSLQAALSVGLNGPAGSDTVVTIQSSDPTVLKFGTSLTSAGLGAIQVTIRKGFITTPTFYARAYNGSGSAQYTISAPAYGSVTTSIPLGPSGFVISTPGGPGADFTVTLGGPDPSLGVLTTLFDGAGKVVDFQPLAPDVNLMATLTSFTPSVGTVSPTAVQILGGTGGGAASFHAVALGFTNITASVTGYTPASVKATVAGVSAFLNPVGSIGQFLAAPGLVNLNTPAATNTPVTLSVAPSSLGRIKLAVNNTDAGANSITVTVNTGNTNAAFWVFGAASSGDATYTASLASSSPVSDTVTLAPSGIALYMGAPGNPSCFSSGVFGCAIPLAGGAKTVYAVAYQLTTDGTINGSQPLAGGTALSVPLSNSAPGIGTAPASVSIPGGSTFGSFSFTPSSRGSTVVAINNLVGWSPPSAYGFDLTLLGITVQ